MGKLFEQYLDAPKFYVCALCQTHLAPKAEILSKGFHGRTGQAYLFNTVVNIDVGPSEERMLMTGSHTVADIFCKRCHAILGWKYEAAADERQQYKVGKFILEKANMTKART